MYDDFRVNLFVIIRINFLEERFTTLFCYLSNAFVIWVSSCGGYNLVVLPCENASHSPRLHKYAARGHITNLEGGSTCRRVKKILQLG